MGLCLLIIPCLFAPWEVICKGETGRRLATEKGWCTWGWCEWGSSEEVDSPLLWVLLRLKSRVSPNEMSSAVLSSMTSGGSSESLWYGLVWCWCWCWCWRGTKFEARSKLKDFRGQSFDSEDLALSLKLEQDYFSQIIGLTEVDVVSSSKSTCKSNPAFH